MSRAPSQHRIIAVAALVPKARIGRHRQTLGIAVARAGQGRLGEGGAYGCEVRFDRAIKGPVFTAGLSGIEFYAGKDDRTTRRRRRLPRRDGSLLGTHPADAGVGAQPGRPPASRRRRLPTPGLHPALLRTRRRKPAGPDPARLCRRAGSFLQRSACRGARSCAELADLTRLKGALETMVDKCRSEDYPGGDCPIIDALCESDP